MIDLTRSVGYYVRVCKKVSRRRSTFARTLFDAYNATSQETMFCQKGICVLLFGLLLMSLTAKYQGRIATGVWGGQHINIKVGAQSATIEYDCASGVINGPLRVDRNGHFSLKGTHRMERGGPVRANDDAQQIPVTYTGMVKGNTMTLTLKLSDTDEETFTLEKGKPGELFKCK